MVHSKRIGALAAAIAVPLTALAVSGCGGGNNANASNGPSTTASGKAATVSLASAGNLGKVLVDAQGRTLYLFQKDSGTRSACTGACATAWPPLRAAGKPVVGAGLSAAKVGTTARSDGKPQVTYNSHPLYLYIADKKPGDTNGQGINAFGGGWFALTAAGNMVSGSGSGSGGGASGY
jgi:predicted lipoprotein with Yx(FWY)xxD motif